VIADQVLKDQQRDQAKSGIKVTDDPVEYHDDKGQVCNPVHYMLKLWQQNQLLAAELIGIFLAHNVINWYERTHQELTKQVALDIDSMRTVVRNLGTVNTEVFFTESYLDGTAPVSLFSDELIEALEELNEHESLIAGTFRISLDFLSDPGFVITRAIWLEKTTEVKDA